MQLRGAWISAGGPAVRTALIHYWLVALRGGEVVLDQLLSLLPGADVFTNVYDPAAVKPLFKGRREPRTTWVNRLPAAARLYPYYLPLMPAALSGLDLDGYDLVISSEAGPAKWAMAPVDARHVCYAHTPMRYLWDQRHAYRERVCGMMQPFYDILGEELRIRDVASAARVDDFVANSSFVARRIEKIYRRDSTVIHPPVPQQDVPAPAEPEEFYLFAGQLAPYKRVRHAVEACLALGRRLVVVGQGPETAWVQRFAGQGVEHHRRLPRHELLSLMGRCRALLLPGVEDFGITTVEVLAAGRPVVALGRGGVVDSVSHGRTGVLYQEAGAEPLKRAIQVFEAWEPSFRPADAVRAARAFSPEVFADKWRTLLQIGPGAPGGLPARPAPAYPLVAASASSTASISRVRPA